MYVGIYACVLYARMLTVRYSNAFYRQLHIDRCTPVLCFVDDEFDGERKKALVSKQRPARERERMTDFLPVQRTTAWLIFMPPQLILLFCIIRINDRKENRHLYLANVKHIFIANEQQQ